MIPRADRRCASALGAKSFRTACRSAVRWFAAAALTSMLLSACEIRAGCGFWSSDAALMQLLTQAIQREGISFQIEARGELRCGPGDAGRFRDLLESAKTVRDEQLMMADARTVSGVREDETSLRIESPYSTVCIAQALRARQVEYRVHVVEGVEWVSWPASMQVRMSWATPQLARQSEGSHRSLIAPRHLEAVHYPVRHVSHGAG